MLLFRIALRNLVRRGRKTLVVIVLITVGIGIFFTGNAILESSISGIKSAFSEKFTADLSVSAQSERSFSLFGPDVPIIEDYESEPPIVNAAEVGERVARVPGVAATAYVLSSQVLLETDGARKGGLGLGVIAEEYFSLFHSLRFTAGAPPALGRTDWAVLTDEWATEIGSLRGRPLAIGEKLQISLFQSQTFTIREARLAGIIHYEPGNEALKRIIITDGRIIRALCGYHQTDAPSSAASGTETATEQAGNLESLFSDNPTPSSDKDQPGDSSAPISMEELKNLFKDARNAGATAQGAALGHDGPWHFILIRTEPGAVKNTVAADLRRGLADAGMAVQVRDWRGTAGGVATYVFLMQIVLYVGLFMLGGISLILTMNSLVMSVFERTAEIGTMRAIGAQKGFVRSLLIAETCSLTLISGIAGILLGFAIVTLLNRFPFHFKNQILILLFGGTSLRPGVSALNIGTSILASLVIGTLAWVYPVRVALHITPVRAIHAG